jgi:hypothetical protein
MNIDDAKRLAAKIVQNICELPDYTSPDDQPELLQCTCDELENAVLNAIEDIYSEG